jgi:hypothetical protein
VSWGWFGEDTDWDTDRAFWRGFEQVAGCWRERVDCQERPRDAGLRVVPKGGVEPPCPREARDFESPHMVCKPLINKAMPRRARALSWPE